MTLYCPKCAAPNLESAKFCRACGADISLLPQVVSGQLAARLETEEGQKERRPHRRKKQETPSIEKAIRSLFSGIAFVLVAFAAKSWAPAGNIWWFWLLIPALMNLGAALTYYMRSRDEQNRNVQQEISATPTQFQPSRRVSALPPRDTGDLLDQPPSVTEATTRHLGVPVERKPSDP
jgi:hypothetical protein